MQDGVPGVAELAALEAEIAAALEAKDESQLPIIGRGEITMAVGWPAEAPRYVCKRTLPSSTAEFNRYQSLVHEYVDQVRALGQAVVDTSVVGVERDNDIVAYIVQPLLDTSTLGNRVLAEAEPDPDHPLLMAIADAVGRTTSTCSVDCQVTNFVWDGEQLTLLDVGTPFLWTENGELRLEIKPFTRILPSVLRGLAVRELTKTVDRWSSPRTVAIDVVANLLREGLSEWTDPTLTALNRRLNFDEPITLAEAQAHYDEDLKVFPMLVRLQRVERWWREKVRRQTYESFIWSTF